MQKLRFLGETFEWFSIHSAHRLHQFQYNNLNDTASLILVKRTLRQGDILKPLPFSFYFVSLLSLLCSLVRITIEMF